MFHVTKVQNDENTLYRQIKTQQLDCERNQGNHSLVYRSAWTRETVLLFCSMETHAQIPLFLTGCVYILYHNNAREVSTALWGRGSTVQVINGNSPGKQEAVVSPHLQALTEFRVSLLFPPLQSAALEKHRSQQGIPAGTPSQLQSHPSYLCKAGTPFYPMLSYQHSSYHIFYLIAV